MPPESAAPRLPRPVPKRYDGRYSRARCAESPPAALLAGIEQFNAGHYWEQHETLETLWRLERDDVRYLYQGILLVGVGLHHLTRGNFHGATKKLAHGLVLLRRFEPACQGVDVARLVADAEACLARLRELGPARLAELDRAAPPKIALLPDREVHRCGGGVGGVDWNEAAQPS